METHTPPPTKLPLLVRVLKQIGKPIKFGKYQKLGIEGIFAMHAFMISFVLTNISTFRGIPMAWIFGIFGSVEAGVDSVEQQEKLFTAMRELTSF